MNSNYFDLKIKTYFLNILSKKQNLISEAYAVRIWHEMFNDEELLQISQEISKIDIFNKLKNPPKEEKLTPSAIKKLNSIELFSQLDDSLLDLDSAEDIFGALKGLPKDFVKRVTTIIIKHISGKLILRQKESNERLIEIQKLFKLNEVELELMTLFYCAEYSEDFEQVAQQSSTQEDIRYPSNSKNFISNAIHFSPHQVIQSLGKSSRLMSLGILESGHSMTMSSEFVDFLSGLSSDALIEKYAKKVTTSDSLKMSNHLIPVIKLETLKAILESKQPCSILFYGKPGTGKTELAKSIAKEVNLDLYSINIFDNEGEDDRNRRKRSLFAVQNHPSISEEIILIDECDQLINSKPNYFFKSNSSDDQKAWLNEYLDINKCKTIWITNSIESIDESTIRRFNYILEFESLSNIQREQILKTLVEKNDCSFLSKEDLQIFSKSERLTSGHFSIALKTAQALDAEDSKKKDYFSNILKEHQNTLGTSPLRLKSINANYCIKGLNIDQSPATVIQQSKKILDRIEADDCDLNLNILLYGPPGTGKTEFVKYLAQELGKEILLKRASDLLSMWVGGSEKNIRKAFEEAEREKKILFIDEADSLLSPREGHNRTWETTQVNEILTCMENFRGILLCATNHVNNLDMAAQRRFLFKMKFDYLSKDGVIYFYDKFFSNFLENKISQSEHDKLCLIQGLTPSDFNNLKRKLEVITPENHEEIVTQLQFEAGYKGNLFRNKVGIVY